MRPAESAGMSVGVRKAYNAGTSIETEVLHGIDLTLRRGEFCAVMGPSGSGKSTLLNIIGLLDRPSAGTLALCGEQTVGLDDRALTRLRGHSIGFVFQYHHLITAFSALESPTTRRCPSAATAASRWWTGASPAEGPR